MALRTVLDGHRTSERTVRSGDDLDARPQGVLPGATTLERFVAKLRHRVDVRYVYGANDAVDHRAYTFCVLDQLREALRRRDVFVTPSWRYADPPRNLLAGAEWEAARPIMCRTLGYSPRPEPILAALSDELDQTYRAVAARASPTIQPCVSNASTGRTS